MVAAHHRLLSPRPHLLSVDPAHSELKSPRRVLAPPRRFRTTQLLPFFSTPRKLHTHTNAPNPFPFYVLLHTSRHAPGRGYHHSSSAFASRPTLPSTVSINPFDATLTKPPENTHSKTLAPNLNSLDATLTRNQGGHPCRRALALRRRFSNRYTLPQSIRYTIPPRYT